MALHRGPSPTGQTLAKKDQLRTDQVLFRVSRLSRFGQICVPGKAGVWGTQEGRGPLEQKTSETLGERVESEEN